MYLDIQIFEITHLIETKVSVCKQNVRFKIVVEAFSINQYSILINVFISFNFYLMNLPDSSVGEFLD